MCLEPPESGLLSRPPRNVRTERLANGRLLLHAYGFLGILESLCAMAMSVLLVRRLISWLKRGSHPQVVLVLGAQRRTVLLASPEVWRLPRGADERLAV